MRLVLIVAVSVVTLVTATCPHLCSPSHLFADSPEVAIAEARIQETTEIDAIDSPGQVVVAYFTPRDRKPAKDHHARISRIVEETASFYQQELKRHGFQGRTLNVLRDDQGSIEIIDVVGRDTNANYNKPDGQKVRNETVEVLRLRGIQADQSVLLLFCNLMEYDAEASTISHHSPYYGGGTHLAGTAWQCDSEILDPLRFQDMTPLRDGEYGRITIGRHNSIFIGGVIHELGHALSLPHCRQRSDEAARGTALMGSGNRTYRQETRGEGRGTFLTLAHALRLAAHPAMRTRVPKSIYQRAGVRTDSGPENESRLRKNGQLWSDLKITSPEPYRLQVRGRVSSSTPVHGVVAYFDPPGGGDYDSTTATDVPDGNGRFELQSDSLRAGSAAELRLVSCHINGTTSQRSFRYSVKTDGSIDLDAVRLELELPTVIDLIRQSKLEAAANELRRVAQDDVQLQAIGQRIFDRFEKAAPAGTIDLAINAPDTVEVPLSSVLPQSARVGWLRPTYDSVPDRGRLLSIDGEYFAKGIYAHAPAEHVYSLGGDWKRLVGRFGVQAGHGGKVDFKIFGDDKLLWRSVAVTASTSVVFNVDLSNVEVLKLVVGDGGDGPGSDWGVWIEPTLTR